MTRDEQVGSINLWRLSLAGRPGAPEAIVDHFPAFMAKCAEIGLCQKTGGFKEPDGRVVWEYGVRQPEPPHEHEWRIAGYIPHEFDLHANTAPEVRVGCRCGASRMVPNRLPIQVPED